MHAPLSAPGGALGTRPHAPRTAAFRCVHTVGLPLRTPWRISCCPQLYSFRGSITRPASSLTPASYSHGWAGTWSSLLTCWRGVRQVGLQLSLSPTREQQPVSWVDPQFQGFGLTLARARCG